jgi:hypothetical protein
MPPNNYISVTNLLLAAILVVVIIALFAGWNLE